jgi:hypothetical protein
MAGRVGMARSRLGLARSRLAMAASCCVEMAASALRLRWCTLGLARSRLGMAASCCVGMAASCRVGMAASHSVGMASAALRLCWRTRRLARSRLARSRLARRRLARRRLGMARRVARAPLVARPAAWIWRKNQNLPAARPAWPAQPRPVEETEMAPETGTRIHRPISGILSPAFHCSFLYVSGRMATLHVEPGPGCLSQNNSLPRETAGSC